MDDLTKEELEEWYKMFPAIAKVEYLSVKEIIKRFEHNLTDKQKEYLNKLYE